MRRLVSVCLVVFLCSAANVASSASPVMPALRTSTVASAHYAAIVAVGSPSGSGATHSQSFQISASLGPFVMLHEPSAIADLQVSTSCAPNPFSTTANFTFSLPRAEHVMVRVLDVTGREVTVLANAPFPAGLHTLRLPGKSDTGRNLSNGIYFVQLTVDGVSNTRRVCLIR